MFTFRQTIKTPSYWIIITVGAIFSLALPIMNVHCIPFLTDMNIDPVVAASMMAMMVFFTIPSRTIGGIIADRVKKEHLKFLLTAAFIFPAVGITAFLLSKNLVGVYAFLILYGFGGGAFVPLDIVIRSRFFGRKAYGSIQGSSVIFSAPISFLAPVYAGWRYDATGNYTDAFILFAALAAFGAFLMLLIRVPKPPSDSSDTG